MIGNKYGSIDELKDVLLYRRVVEWDEDKIVLDDGTVVTIEMSEWDCCATAGGEFTNVELDAAITDVVIGEKECYEVLDTYESSAVVKLYHNQNEIAQAEATADAGNGGFYYSVASLKVKGVYYPVVHSGDGMEDN